jgi:hypothetical protein
MIRNMCAVRIRTTCLIFISYPCSSLVELGADMAGASFTSHIITLERLDLAIEGTNKDAVNQGLNAQKMQQWNAVFMPTLAISFERSFWSCDRSDDCCSTAPAHARPDFSYRE